MDDIIKAYQAGVQKYTEEVAKLEEKKDLLRARIDKATTQLERLEEAERKLQKPTRYDVIRALAERLSEHYGLPYEIYGPFGMECETSIYLRRDMSDSIADQKTISLTLRAFGDRENDWITYDTGARTNEYPKGSLGWLNGMNAVFAPLPKDFQEILKLTDSAERNDFVREAADEPGALDTAISAAEAQKSANKSVRRNEPELGAR